jgi:RND family efflux transporter MFP subunit
LLVNIFSARRRRFLLVLALLALAAALAAGISACGRATSKDARYYCPMHPTYVSGRPGDCPICNMRLVKAEKGISMSDLEPTKSATEPPALAAGPPDERKILFYRSPMDPSITSPVPRKDDMGMDYVPVYSDEVESEPGGIEGLAPVAVGAEARRLAGIQTAPARRELLLQGIRAVGTVVPDETRIRVVHTKVAGWIDKLHVNFMGQFVRRGQPIVDIYSPELLASQEEFLRALAASRQLAGATPEASGASINLVQAARRRLELFDVPPSFIATLERTGEPQRAVTLHAPASGYVTAKDVFEGQQIQPGMELFAVTDFSRVWIEADVYEYEAPLVQVGQQATLSLPFDPNVQLDGRVDYVYPYMNPETRTLKVRFQFLNRDLVLKPAMYVDVSLRAREEVGIVVPESAVHDSGLRQVAFVETTPGRFEPREVRTGVRGDGKVQIVAGVQEGELVVVHATFLLDSESRLRSALSASAERAGVER